jgi:Ca-activated chloride channel homolog
MYCRSSLLPLLAFVLVITSSRAQDRDRLGSLAANDEVISLDTNLVVLNVTITDQRGRYVSGLKAEEFSILEDNFPQNILSFGFEETPFVAAILLDTSASMDKKLALERAACTSFVQGMRGGDAFAIYSFGGTTIKRLRDFTRVRNIPDSVWDIRGEGTTPLYDAILTVADSLARRPERRRAILIVSDGADTQSKSTLGQAMQRVIGAQISIYAVDMSDTSVYGAIARDNGTEVMKVMAAKSGGKFFRTPGGNKLREAFASTVNELRSQYTLAYESTNDRYDGRWRAIEVRIVRPKLNVRARQGYYAHKKSA